MSGAVRVAIAAAVGDFLLGWDNATIAGAVMYIKKEFNLQTSPTIEGLIVSMSLIGATLITTCSGAISDSVGRRPMLVASSACYITSSLIMLWSPNVYTLLLARLVGGFGVGLAVTLGPLYISETAPSEIRGLLNTLPQFAGSCGMFLSYCMVFSMSLMDTPNWRLMLGTLGIPSLLYLLLTVFYLAESPRWLVSKGRMVEAKKVLQRLRGREDVFGEMALLVEGLGIGSETAIEEYIIGPDTGITDEIDPSSVKDQIKLYGQEEGLSWLARPVGEDIASRRGSIRSIQPNMPLMDPLVTLFGSVHEKPAGTDKGSMRSIIFPTFGSMFSVGGNQAKNEEWDEDDEENDYASVDHNGVDNHDSDDNNLHTPLMSRQATSMEKELAGSLWNVKPSGFMPGSSMDSSASMGIGGGWQLAWKWNEDEGLDGKKRGGLKRVYLHQDGASGSKRGSMLSVAGGGGGDVDGGEIECFKASALVSDSALYSKGLIGQNVVGPAMFHPSQANIVKGPTWRDLLEPGVRHALVVGVGIQMLQQFSGINGVLYYTPQILEQAGVGVLLSNLGLSSTSASLLISVLTTLLMLPAIAIAMRLMDISGRRTLLLTTIPVLIIALLVLILASIIPMSTVVHAALSTASVIAYFCVFVAGFGPIPNILCAEIFPTRVRGLCIAICALTFWICDIIVTYSLPVMLNSIGLAGVFGMYAIVCVVSFIFVFLKVPETKGMPLEVIIEFFALGSKTHKE